jgi:AcrR family transcriptional regulator
MVPFVNREEEESVKPRSEAAVAVADGTDPSFESCEAARPLRADAQRNRIRVLEAAEAVFAAEGLSVPIDVIAEKAGVGVGTLYRHFPTKEKLFEAIVIDRVTTLAAEARCRTQAEDPGAAFFGFLDHMVDVSASKRDLIMALAGAGVEFEVVAADANEELKAALEELLSRAQAAGAVRSDVTAPVVMSLVGGTCMAADHPGQAETAALLAIVCDGLRAQASA